MLYTLKNICNSFFFNYLKYSEFKIFKLCVYITRAYTENLVPTAKNEAKLLMLIDNEVQG